MLQEKIYSDFSVILLNVNIYKILISRQIETMNINDVTTYFETLKKINV